MYEIKYLGLTIDSNLNWNSQIDNIIKKIKPYIGVFKRITQICNDHVKKLLYYSFVHSNLIYMITIWNGTKEENLKRIEIFQNKAIRNLFYNRYNQKNIKTGDLYNEYKIIKYRNLIESELKINFHKICNGILRAKIDIQYNNEIHCHNTKQSKKARKIKNKNNWGKKSIINRFIGAYNQIKTPIKKLRKTIFKNKIKGDILLMQKQCN